ncbi:MAG: O-antigen ligase family protein [Ignavibacteriae bacterium]|nr:O-antigen ligase family protein [Ignavibacteriota bacterium]
MIFGLTVFASIIWHKKKYAYPKYSKVLFSLFILTAIISLVIGSAKGKEYLYVNISDLITYYLGFILFFYIGYQSIENAGDLYKIVLILFIFGLMTAAGHIFSITTGINLEMMRGQEMVSASRDLSEGNWRYGGFFGNVNSMSAFYVMLIPGGLVLLFNEVRLSIRVISVIAILLMIISTFIGASRGALLFIALNIILSLFFLKINLKQILIGIGFIIALVFGAELVIGNYLQEFFDRAIDEITRKGTESPREIIWFYTFKIIRDYPLGVGLTWHDYSPILMKYGNIFWANPHSMYLQMLVQTGYLGFVSFLLLVVQAISFIIRAYKKTRNSIEKNAFAFVFLFITGFLLMGITEPIFTNQYKLNYIFGIILGISLSFSKRILDLNQNQINTTFGENFNETIVQNG